MISLKRRSTDRVWHLVVLAILSVSGFIVAGQLAAGCAHVKSIGVGVGECALSALPQIVTDVVPIVESILQSGATSNEIATQLANLGEKDGIGVVICAVQKAISEFFGAMPTTGALAPQKIAAIQEGEKWLSAQGVHVSASKVPTR